MTRKEMENVLSKARALQGGGLKKDQEAYALLEEMNDFIWRAQRGGRTTPFDDLGVELEALYDKLLSGPMYDRIEVGPECYGI